MKKKLPIIIISSLTLIIFLFFTVAFAAYSKNVAMSGNVTLRPNGVAEITSITRLSEHNLNTDSYTIDGTDITFSLLFNNVGSSATYDATYEVTIVNNSFYAYEFTNSTYVPSIAVGQNENISVAYNFTNLNPGDSIPSGGSKTFSVTITVTVPEGYTGEISMDGTISQEYEQPEAGSLLGSLTGSTSGNLSGNNNYAQFTVEVINSYDYNKTFTLNLSDTSKFNLVNCNGSAFQSQTIPANTTGTYTFCITKVNGAAFASSPQNASVILECSGLNTASVGAVSLVVDVDPTLSDNEPPIISGVTAKKGTNSGDVRISWSGTDDSSVDHYTILAYNSDDELQETYTTTADETFYNITNHPAGTYYYVVYGTDKAQTPNTASQDDINRATTASGYASKSEDLVIKWVYNIVTNYSNISGRNSAETINHGDTYQDTLSASTGRSLPDTITVKMNNVTLTRGTGYTYSSSSGQLRIPNVTGDIDITATATGCLIEGTKVLLANGKYKNVEDITYYDLLSVWNYDTGKLTYTYPAFIEKVQYISEYTETTFSDGTKLNTYDDHGIFSFDLNRYILTTDPVNYKVGAVVAKVSNGKLKKVTIKSIKQKKKHVGIYHVVSNGYFNLIANDVLTTEPNIMISNQYGFVDGVKWPEGTRKNIINNKDNLYDYDEFKDIMSYYMFKALRVNEGKYVVDSGAISLDLLKYYLKDRPANPHYFKDLPKKDGKRILIVTTSLDDLKDKNANKILEGSYYKLKNDKRVKYYINTTNNTKYYPGSMVRIDTSTHFIAVRK